HNIKSVGPELIARLQGLSEYFQGETDPLLHRIFGAVITAANGRRLDDTRLQSPEGKHHRFSICVLTEHPSSPEKWLASVDQLMADTDRKSFPQRRADHEAWWRRFWQRSWIHVSGGGPRRFIPQNEHPIRIGIDQHGHNEFVGELGRVTIVPRAMTDSEIDNLSGIAGDGPLPALDDLLYQGRPAEPLSVAGSTNWTFGDGLTIEAWIKPGDMPQGGGRIVDKTTPGAADGLLFDTYPGRSLRLIVGDCILSRENVLPEGRWSHVAASIDPGTGRLAVFLNGDEVVSRIVDTADDATAVSRAYALQRYVTACAGRGRYPIKFNGSIFTVPFEGKFGDADYRRWGPGYWWQNTRLPYLSMCAGGDFEMMRPLFRMYADDLLPLHKFRTKLYTGHDGAFIPECMYFWGPTFTATYGWTPFAERGDDKLQESGWHKREWVAGPELVWMMLDYYDHTLDESFARRTLLPFAHEVLTFFDQHYETDEQGRLVMEPSQALETWWDCTNPMPELAGLYAITTRLLSLPADLSTSAERIFWAEFRNKLPALPTRQVDGVEMLAPAQRFAEKRNIENPELYAVFPFRLVSFEKRNARLGIEALKHRWDRGNFGWRQNDLFMAYLGLADEARDSLVGRSRNKHHGSRFPAFWGPNYDWVPDQDHGGVLMRTLQSMLMQTDGKRIHLLPAWPKEWDVDFKLHAPYQTIVSGKVRNGRLLELAVRPESRREDVLVHEPTISTERGAFSP
ncbi:MAG: LamG domain-containing protein, partial [Phycisphaerales bacterium]